MKRKQSIRERLTIWIPYLMVVFGLISWFYPEVASHYYRLHHQAVIESIYRENELYVKPSPKEVEEYQAKLRAGDYASAQDMIKRGALLGSVSLPKINETLPIFYGSSDAELEMGVGTIELFDLPYGGPGAHSILTAHRGMAQADLFLHLDKMLNGDLFYVNQDNEILAYRIIKTQILHPWETDKVYRDNTQDLVTLFTCDPPFINTKRLLKTGKRIDIYDLTKQLNTWKERNDVSQLPSREKGENHQ